MLNRVFLMGRLTDLPEIGQTANGRAYAHFTLAVERDYQSGNDRKATDFINCTAWGNTAEFIHKYFGKGDMAVVVGRLYINQWEGAEGIKRREANINVENVYFGQSKRREENTNGVYDGEPENAYSEMDIDDGDLPF